MSLTPPDLKRCQAEKPNGHSFMTLGGSPGRERCKDTPLLIATENEKGPDGLLGSMSLCLACANVLVDQKPGYASFRAINPRHVIVAIRERETDKLIRIVGVAAERTAEKIICGAIINLNSDTYYVWRQGAGAELRVAVIKVRPLQPSQQPSGKRSASRSRSAPRSSGKKPKRPGSGTPRRARSR